jgi:hypothetical protein
MNFMGESEGLDPDDLAHLLSGDWEDVATEEQPLSDWLLSEAEVVLTLYVPPVLILLGLLCSIVVLLPAIRLAFCSAACPLHIYTVLVVLLHTILLTGGYGLLWADMYFTGSKWLRKMRAESEAYCLVTHYFQNFFVGLDRWLLVAFTGECLTLARHPERTFRLRRNHVLDVVIIVLATMAGVNMHHFWTNEIEVYEHTPTLQHRVCRLRVRHLNGDEGSELYGMIIRHISLLVVDLLPSLALLAIFALAIRMKCRQCSVTRCCSRKHTTNNNRRQSLNHEHRCRPGSESLLAGARTAVHPSTIMVTVHAHEAARLSGEEEREAWKRRAAHFVLDNDSYDDMARGVGPALGLAYVVCVVPNLLLVQPIDRLIMQRLESTDQSVWTLIMSLADTLHAAYLTLPPIILLVNCRRYRSEITQVIRKRLLVCC